MSKDEKRQYLILKDNNIFKGLLILAWPLMLNNIARTFHDLVDTYFVSKVGNAAESISAIQITFPITFVYISLGFGLSIAGTALISQFRGANLIDEAKKYSSQLILIAFVLGLVLLFVSYFFSPTLMWIVTRESGYVLEKSSRYLQIRAFELPLLIIFFAFTAIRQASGDTLTPVILGIIAIIINIILTPILVINAGLGVEGAAYATLIGNLAIGPVGIYLLFRSKNGITISLKYLKPVEEIIIKLLKTALPASIGQALTAFGFFVLNIILFSYGTDIVAAFSTGNRISSIFLHPVMAIGGVMAAYIGQNIGNLNPKRAKEAYHKGLILSVVIMTFGSIAGIMIRSWAAGQFLEVGSAGHDLTTTYMLYLFIGLPLMAVYTSHVGAFNGNGKTMYTFWLGTIRLWAIRIPFIWAFGTFTNLGSSGIWYAMLISNFLIAILGFVMMTRVQFTPKVNLEPQLS